MPKNQLTQSFYLLLLVMALLALASGIGAFTWSGIKFKSFNLLSDIQKTPIAPPVIVKKDSIVRLKKKPQVIANCAPGVFCLEDYTLDHLGIKRFKAALRKAGREAIYIAFYGDSFIEGDILTAPFRDTLQQLYGGHGVGFVPITSEVSQFRTTISHSFNHWDTYSIVGKKNEYNPAGIAGYCFRPAAENEVSYSQSPKNPKGRFRSMSFFYTNPLHASLAYSLGDSLAYEQALTVSDSLEQYTLPEKNFSSIRMTFPNSDSLRLYGAAFNDSTGVYVDNLSMRGNSGIGLYQIPTAHLKQFGRHRNYRLILLQYGLNVVNENDTTDYNWYTDRMTRVVNRIQEVFPQASIVLISVSDRSYNQNGNFVTMPGIPMMRDAQREIARRCHIYFWDLFTAMGGTNSMVRYVKSNPPLAAKDYTHLTYWGGRRLAKKLADGILVENINHVTKKP